MLIEAAISHFYRETIDMLTQCMLWPCVYRSVPLSLTNRCCIKSKLLNAGLRKDSPGTLGFLRQWSWRSSLESPQLWRLIYW